MREIGLKNIISKVYSGSIAEEVGIQVGDELLKINSHEIEDIIEYKYYLADEYLEVEILKTDGEHWIVEVDKEYDEDLGIEFENPIIDQAKSCRNKCVFCFIDQLPPNMRQSLYFKDDDSRLSFLQGNYITLTNMSEEDINKIIKYRISPINISVHTTNGELRKKMLNNRFAGNILNILTRLAENNIEMNCQIVLCPDLNDREELDNTIKDLGNLSYSIGSVAVVPVGLTAYREGLHKMDPFNKETASYTIDQVQKWQKKFKSSIGRNFVHVSDEFYVLADRDFPNYESYEGFPQLENGVGLSTKFKYEFYQYLRRLPIALKRPKHITVATGTAAYKLIKTMCDDLTEKIGNLKVEVICVENKFFGGHVSVSGLITGQDIYNTLKDKYLGDKILIPESMMKAEEEIFLDDYTVTLLEEKLGVPIQVCEVEGKKFIQRALNLRMK
ncbi:DUF512 domain-containing protein [Alkaliphilus sp. MSJ-5]|uniref:DUF512 domain-containing protein n=1 Tax=Alkaliphilus flagellatus TaxID=2841507 RepID=A0ABS6G4A1_9FIRM|nr:DUF512 domain-containing protein [Alkaliphilus flagellatus]MBU5677320.1 DUF512 domain-containing protein [Alkaliphilus flagellatus]